MNSVKQFVTIKNAFALKVIRFSIFFISITILNSKPVVAQSSFEFWPETDIWYKASDDWRLSMFVPVTKYYESKTRDLNVTLQADYKFGKTKRLMLIRLNDEGHSQQVKPWMVRGGYIYGKSLHDDGDAYFENTGFAELHKRVPLRGRILLSQRFRTELRWLGQDPDFSYRLRYRLLLEKELLKGKTSVIPYFSVEPFFDSRFDNINRVRCIGGTTVAWKHWFALEGNLTYQFDAKPEVKNVFALNLIMHIFLESKKMKEEKSQ